MADGGSVPRPREASGGVAVSGPVSCPRRVRTRPRALARGLRGLAAALLLAIAGLLVPAHQALAQDVSDDTLSALTVQDASNDATIALSPAFDPTVTNYTASVPHTVNRITLTATTSGEGASVYVLDNADDSIGDADRNKDGLQVNLPVGLKELFILVESADETEVGEYIVSVTRAAADLSDATLSALKLQDASSDAKIALSPAFDSAVTAYTASVAHAVNRITLTATTSESGASIAYLARTTTRSTTPTMSRMAAKSRSASGRTRSRCR